MHAMVTGAVNEISYKILYRTLYSLFLSDFIGCIYLVRSTLRTLAIFLRTWVIPVTRPFSDLNHTQRAQDNHVTVLQAVS